MGLSFLREGNKRTVLFLYPGSQAPTIEQAEEEVRNRHCEERFLRRSNLVILEILNDEFASLRSQRQQQDFFSGLPAVAS
jgi:hypothetical protein